jgi:hypothetical protein
MSSLAARKPWTSALSHVIAGLESEGVASLMSCIAVVSVPGHKPREIDGRGHWMSLHIYSSQGKYLSHLLGCE